MQNLSGVLACFTAGLPESHKNPCRTLTNQNPEKNLTELQHKLNGNRIPIESETVPAQFTILNEKNLAKPNRSHPESVQDLATFSAILKGVFAEPKQNPYKFIAACL